MEYKIIAYHKDYPIFKFTSSIVPKIGETIYGPHRGLFKVTDLRYHISDDCDDFENKLMWVELLLIDEGELTC